MDTANSHQNGKKIDTKPLKLRCSVQNYDWGKIGSNSEVARLFSLNSNSSVEPKKPYAEIWIGTHESGPSYVDQGSEIRNCAGNGTLANLDLATLKSWILGNPNVLGPKVLENWGLDLPFLFKVLSVEKALSLQAHPDKELAGALHKSQPGVYKDENYKPEMALALSDFEALCGFISSEELKDVLRDVPEILELASDECKEQIASFIEEGAEKSKEGKVVLQSFFSRLMLLTKEEVTEMTSKMIKRLNVEKEERQLTDKEQLVLKLEGQYRADAGVIAVFFLNHLKLKRGEAINLGPNEPHAYISGDCIECMATSDNVVRAGLTPKQRDIQTLLSMLKYKQGAPETLHGVYLNPYTRRFSPPFDEFEVDCCNLPLDASVVFPSVPGPSLFLFFTGKGTLDSGTSGHQIIKEGDVLFVPAYMEIRVTAKSTELELYRAGVNSRFLKDP